MRKPRQQLNQLSEDYAQTLTEMQAMCETQGHNFRREMMLLAEQWIARHNPPQDDTPGHDHQARKTR